MDWQESGFSSKAHMAKKHLSETYSRAGVLSRDREYRERARPRNKGTGIYDDEVQIKKGLDFRVAQTGNTHVLGKTVKQRVPFYKFDYTKPNRNQNFTIEHLPYLFQAHHILPTEVFTKKKWTAKHLRVVLTSKYKINEPENIIYLPQCEGMTWTAHVHKLPDHSKNHPAYNKRVIGEAEPVFDMVEEALDENDCDEKKDLRKQIYDKLKQVETSNLKKLEKLGPKPLK